MNIKLIWDFYGPDAEQTAEHHEIHLKEFSMKEKLHFEAAGVQRLGDTHSIAFITVNQSDMKIYRDALKPHRGVKA